jgi:hypothetical protein
MRHGDNPNNFRVNPGMILTSIETSFLPIKQHLQPFCAGKRTCPVESAGAEESGRKERAGISGHNRVADPFSQTRLEPVCKTAGREDECGRRHWKGGSGLSGAGTREVKLLSGRAIGPCLLFLEVDDRFASVDYLAFVCQRAPACSLENKSRSVKPISSDGSFLP